MKKLTFGLILIAALGSCKKDYNCSCDYFADGEYQATNETNLHETKHKAKKECKDMNNEVTFNFGGMSLHTETKCSIK